MEDSASLCPTALEDAASVSGTLVLECHHNGALLLHVA